MRRPSNESQTNVDLVGASLVVGAAILWGSLGIAARAVTGAGMTLFAISWWRATLAAAGFAGLCLAVDPKLLRVRREDLPLLASYGFFSIALFYLAYLTAIERTTLATAAILLYTGPGWVIVLSTVFLGEPWTRAKGLALGLAFAGCGLVARAQDLGAMRLDPVGLAAGLCAGLLYGAYSIFAKRALRRQPPLTVVTYGVLFGSLFLLPIGAIAGTPVAAFAPPPAAWPALLYLSLISTVGASGMYVGALNRIEAGRASILATLEPVVAASIGVAVFGERLDAWQLFGGALVLAAGLVVTAGARRSRGRARGG